MTHNKIMGQKVLRKHREEENKTTTQKKPPKPPKEPQEVTQWYQHNVKTRDTIQTPSTIRVTSSPTSSSGSFS